MVKNMQNLNSIFKIIFIVAFVFLVIVNSYYILDKKKGDNVTSTEKTSKEVQNMNEKFIDDKSGSVISKNEMDSYDNILGLNPDGSNYIENLNERDVANANIPDENVEEKVEPLHFVAKVDENIGYYESIEEAKEETDKNNVEKKAEDSAVDDGILRMCKQQYDPANISKEQLEELSKTVSSEVNVNFYYGNYITCEAIKNKDYDYCKDLKKIDQTIYNDCLRKFVNAYIQKEKCSEFAINSCNEIGLYSKEMCNSMCSFFVNNDNFNCEENKNEIDINICKAVTKGDMSGCNSISGDMLKENCYDQHYYNVALVNDDRNAIDNLSNMYKKALAGATLDSSYSCTDAFYESFDLLLDMCVKNNSQTGN